MADRPNPAARPYLHFDLKRSFLMANGYCGDPERIARHSFYPFLTYTNVHPRYHKDERKVADKCRQICYAAHLDSAIYSHYAGVLSRPYEEFLAANGLSDHVIAYRKPGRANYKLADEAFQEIDRRKETAAICIDISQFFDSICHLPLKQNWCRLLGVDRLPEDHYKVFKSITKFAAVDRDDLYGVLGLEDKEDRDRIRRICDSGAFRAKVRPLIQCNEHSWGIPQGSPISAVLSNIYMIPFDVGMADFCRDVDAFYRRYSDDILLLVSPDKAAAALELVRQGLGEIGLQCNEDKTEVIRFRQTDDGTCQSGTPLQYLGLTYDGKHVLLRSSTISRYYRRLRKYVRASARDAKACGASRLFRAKAFKSFTMRGRRNFVTYAQRADGMVHASGIGKQIRRHWQVVNALLGKADRGT